MTVVTVLDGVRAIAKIAGRKTDEFASAGSRQEPKIM